MRFLVNNVGLFLIIYTVHVLKINTANNKWTPQQKIHKDYQNSYTFQHRGVILRELYNQQYKPNTSV